MDLRTVTVELLRAGPRHNQLISPTTQYLGVCGNAPAGRVTLPYEHGDLERRLQELRYRVTDDDDPMRSSKVLDRIGRDVAQILSGIPGVSGLLDPESEHPQTLTHLRIVLSASELALVPFEASKVPTGEGSGAVWLALKVRSPVCITRHIRSVSAEGIRWPLEPRILFIAGPDTPADKHEQALRDAMAPWRDANASLDGRFTALRGDAASLAGVADAVEQAARKGNAFTHVHILAHGAPMDDRDRYSAVGIALQGGEIVSGLRLATALTSVTSAGVARPTVVTLATCDSGAVTDVRSTDASIAHDLHDQGIALVVASQFPLSVKGSVPFVEHFYRGQMWGDHPLLSLYDVRLQLHSRMGAENHDWASLVVYEAFPSDLAAQLEDLRYWQARRAQNGGLGRLEALGQTLRQAAGAVAEVDARRAWDEQRAEVDALSARLPLRGPYALECAGLRAGGSKRAALAAFELATSDHVAAGWRSSLLHFSHQRLQQARATYWQATRSFLGSWAEPGRKKANLHWLLGQVLSLDVVLGQPLDSASLAAARLAAETDLEGPGETDRAWAYVSLAELALLRLTDASLPDAERSRWAQDCLQHARRVLQLLGPGSEHAFTTARQFERYVDWWGQRDLQWALARLGVPERPHWHLDDGLVPTARRVVALLRGAAPADADEPAAPPPAVPPAPPRITPAIDAPAAGPPAAGRGNAPSRALFSIEMLPAANGDCLWIEYGDAADPRRVLVDCGAQATAAALAARIDTKASGTRPAFELFVLTHIDADHINGVLPLFEQPGLGERFGDIWFNGWQQMNQFLSVKQGEAFSQMLGDPARALRWNRAFTSPGQVPPAPVVMVADAVPPSVTLPGGLRLTLLSPGPRQMLRMARTWSAELRRLAAPSALLGRRPEPVTDPAGLDLVALALKPTRKDPSTANGSSIALLAEFDGRAVLLTGDAHADVLATSIKSLQQARGLGPQRLRLDALKLSHHGSANATTIELLDLLDCPRYLVSTDGSIFQHPDREAIARVIVHGGPAPTLYFNHRSERSSLWAHDGLRQRWGYQAVYPSQGQAGLRVDLD